MNEKHLCNMSSIKVMNMNRKLIIFLTSVISFGIGGLAGYIYSKRKYEKLADIEVESIKKKLGLYSMQNKNKSDVQVEQKQEPEKTNEADISLGFNKETKEGYRDYSAPYRSNGVAIESGKKDEDTEEPYIIDLEELSVSEYEVKTLLYYQDGTLTDEDGNVINESERDSMIGKSVLTVFDNNDLDVIYVQNDVLQIDYEIILESRNFKSPIVNLHPTTE